MKEIESEVQAANGRPTATNGMAAHADAALLAETSDAPAVATVSTVRSPFGPAGAFAKRVIERLMRLYAGRQEAVNARLTARLQRLEAEVAGVRPDLVAAALDFGAIADRMRAFENVRRVVERSAPFRYEVRNHRRELAELHQHVAALSARLTLIQRESAPVRAAVDGVRDEFDALREACERLAERSLEAEASIQGASERLTGLAHDAEDRKAAAADAEDRIAHLQTDIEQVRSATARDLAQRSTELRAVVEEVERRLSATAEHLTGLVEKRGRASDLTFEALRSTLTANSEELRTGLEDRIERAQRTAATLRTAFDAFQREATEEHARTAAVEAEDRKAAVAAAENRIAHLQADIEQLTGLVEKRGRASDLAFEALRSALTANHEELRTGLEDRIESAQRTAATLRTAFDVFQREATEDRARAAVAETERLSDEERIDAIQRRLADIAGALNAIHDSTPEFGALEQRLERLAAEFEALRGKAEATPKRIGAIQRRLADVAGALNVIRDSAVAEQAAATDRLREAVGAVRSELATARAPEFGALEQRLEQLAAEFEALCGRLGATPYMSAPPEAWPELRLSTPDDFDYLGFEDVFRGPEPFIRERLRAYVPLIVGRAPVVELGSGRGEFLEVMRENGIVATGVDLNAHAVARARAKGLDNVVVGDANAYLAGLEKSSVGAIFSAQFAEHLPFAELLRCLELARTRLVPGGVFIAETINPNSIEAWKTFYVDPSHEKPLFPEIFLFLCRSMGFSDVRIFYPNGGGFAEAAPTMQHEYAVVATAPTRDGSKTAAPPSAPNGPRRRRKARRRE